MGMAEEQASNSPGKCEILLGELRARLINTEHKVNALIESDQRRNQADWKGVKDQVFGHITYSQHGEDMIALSMFYTIGIRKPSYLDVGAHHPLNISNTALMYVRGSRGINIEANPELIANFHTLRPDDVNLNIGVGPKPGIMPFYRIDKWSGRNSFDKESVEAFVRESPKFQVRDVVNVEVRTLNNIVDEYAGGVFPDFLSMDIEGLDYSVLESTDFNRSKPKIVCTEIISAGHADDGKKTIDMMETKGFFLAFRALGNLFFVPAELAPAFLSAR